MISKNKILLISVIFITIFFFLFLSLGEPQTNASSSDNVSGWVWSENIGWISLNCTNTTCASSNFGVNIDPATGNFSGYAWSENIGWISFEPSDLSGCPSGTCVANLDFGTGNVSGWAKAIAADGSWDGWIKFDGPTYQVNYDNSSKKFSGWAWGSDVMGWISFSSSNCDTDSNGYVDSGDCGGDNSTTPVISYGGEAPSLNSPPTASGLAVSSHSSSTYCPSAPQGLHTFSWTYSDYNGDNESKFQFQVDNNSNFNTPEVNREITISVPSGSANNQSVSVVSGGGSDKLDFNKTYYWRVKVFDSGSPQQDSGWIEGSSFGTANHSYPRTDFSWSPQTPEINKTANFTDASSAYGSGNPIQSWSWQFEDANPSTSSDQNPSVIFTEKGNKNVSLNATDRDGYSCQTSKTIRIIKEVKIKEI